MVPVFEVENLPDFEATLSLQDVFNSGQWVSVVDCCVILPTKVFHESIFPWLLFWHWEGGAIPWPHSWLDLS